LQFNPLDVLNVLSKTLASQQKTCQKNLRGSAAMNFTSRACVALVFGVLLVEPLAASDPVGKVLSAKTTVSSGKRVLQANDGVFFLDRLSTNQTGIGEFMFKDGTKLALGPSASLVVDQFVQGPIDFPQVQRRGHKGNIQVDQRKQSFVRL